MPQQISGYEFRLIGDMTLKQFGELALGVILAMVCWSLPLAIFFKYFLAGFFVFMGICLAFVPFNEQPLDRWIINFFKAVYSPTQFVWKKSSVTLDFLARPAYVKVVEPTKPVVSRERKKLEEYLKTVPTSSLSPFEQEIEETLSKITSIFEDLGIPSAPKPEEEEIPPLEKIRPVRLVQIPKEEPLKVPKPKKKIKKKAKKPERIVLPHFKRAPHGTIAPKFEPELPMPSRPTVPNILVGMVLDPQGKILPDVIIEIRDERGFPVRALRANKLGQFRIANPLKNGVYEIELEKEGYKFDIIKFKAKGEIIEPMEIRAKEKLT